MDISETVIVLIQRDPSITLRTQLELVDADCKLYNLIRKNFARSSEGNFACQIEGLRENIKKYATESKLTIIQDARMKVVR